MSRASQKDIKFPIGIHQSGERIEYAPPVFYIILRRVRLWFRSDIRRRFFYFKFQIAAYLKVKSRGTFISTYINVIFFIFFVLATC